MIHPESKSLNNLKTFLIWLILFFIPIANITYARLKTSEEDVLVSSKKTNELALSGLQIKSIDTQIVSKHWGEIERVKIAEQVDLLKDLGANYIAISTPYDYEEIIRVWAEEIHKAGLNVWFRSHWLNWEGEEGYSSDMSMTEYLDKTEKFIKLNPSLFQAGDSFTVCVEPEQVYTKRSIEIIDWQPYNQFVIENIEMADKAFSQIGFKNKIHTNWISMNGWVVENGLFKETVDKMGVITLDHYPDQDVDLSPSQRADKLAKDIELVYKKWQKPIILGEWGYNVLDEISDDEQKEVLSHTFGRLKDIPFVIGINYWSHLGNSSRIIDDIEGKNLNYRPAAYTLKEFFIRNY